MDRFYTPDSLASKLMAAIDSPVVNSCADPNCGHGQLLLSAEAQWPDAECWGLDIDRDAVRRVRRRRPRWIVSVGDLLSPTSIARTKIFRMGDGCDVLLANPPFSMGGDKGIVRAGVSYRCSVAMAHILAAIELFRPRCAIGAIVPESMLHSELDEAARGELAVAWTLEEVLCVPQATFGGTRAHAALVVLRPANGKDGSDRVLRKPTAGVAADVVRGGLPVHQAESASDDGLPFVHSTDLKALASGAYRRRTVRPIGRGCVVGPMLLLPRVGVPSIEQMVPLEFEQPIQMSDCVIGLRFSGWDTATEIARVIRDKSESLVDLYKGTGARYVTVRRIEEWCVSVGIEPCRTGMSIGEVLVGSG